MRGNKEASWFDNNKNNKNLNKNVHQTQHQKVIFSIKLDVRLY